MDGGRHQNALALCRGTLEQGVVHPAPLHFIQQHIFAGSGDYRKTGIPRHGSDHIGVATGAVDQKSTMYSFAAVSGNGKRIGFLDLNNGEISF